MGTEADMKSVGGAAGFAVKLASDTADSPTVGEMVAALKRPKAVDPGPLVVPIAKVQFAIPVIIGNAPHTTLPRGNGYEDREPFDLSYIVHPVLGVMLRVQPMQRGEDVYIAPSGGPTKTWKPKGPAHLVPPCHVACVVLK